MTNEQRQEKLKTIENVLNHSDIVWPKYGGESIPELAEKILKKLEVKADEIPE